jgi:hypothetical protein
MTRRDLLRTASATVLATGAKLAVGQLGSTALYKNTELWDCFEFTLAGPTTGNPFLDVKFGAVFKHDHSSTEVAGFYDGDGKYKVRFMPSIVGAWTFVTISNIPALRGHEGTFECTPVKAGNHGPVVVKEYFILSIGMGHLTRK